MEETVSKAQIRGVGTEGQGAAAPQYFVWGGQCPPNTIAMKCTVHVDTVHCDFLSMVLHVTSMVLYYDIPGMCSTFFKNLNVTFQEAESAFHW